MTGTTPGSLPCPGVLPRHTDRVRCRSPETTDLVVDPPGIVALSADDVKPTQLHDQQPLGLELGPKRGGQRLQGTLHVHACGAGVSRLGQELHGQCLCVRLGLRVLGTRGTGLGLVTKGMHCEQQSRHEADGVGVAGVPFTSRAAGTCTAQLYQECMPMQQLCRAPRLGGTRHGNGSLQLGRSRASSPCGQVCAECSQDAVILPFQQPCEQSSELSPSQELCVWAATQCSRSEPRRG